ncbi:DUF4124 domain-containing protein [Methylophaga sulfidovorans]|uniref:DUF4124 domain-containing protein n=1 Tax=Methylophaga sulfidovorans TaxID=45496 RepID=A0A1I3UUG4_9GAMM|nr:DUF4124 domain-containing protein [Methylophaga sulfidovorans]SFJ87004.1 protein of unknown function [Methylophaga sulfidovorans]
MRVIYLIFLLLFSSQVLSAIYRWVEPDGTVVFSDEEHPGAETIELPPSATYSPPEVQQVSQTEPEQDTSPAPDYQISITAPAANESIWVNNGDVKVTLSVEPALDVDRGDAIQVYLDGQTVGDPQATTSYQFTNLSRGSHEITAKIISADDKELASDNIVFHLHRASKLN